MTEDGVVTTASAHPFVETLGRLESALRDKGMTVFARVDHSAGAVSVGLSLRPTVLILFGNPKGGTPLMQAAQKIGLELPLKVLVWQDESAKTWLSYDDPAWLARRFGIDPALAAVAALSSALEALTNCAASA
jgi:uncharacterized protein (DUF302 family)